MRLPPPSTSSFSGGCRDIAVKVQVATLADHALAHEDDGRLYITGGGLASLSFDQFPAIQKRLALALSLELLRSEFDHPHELRILASGPNSPAFQTVAFQFSLPSSGPGKDFDTVNFVSSMDEVLFKEPGVYSFDVKVDDVQLATVRLHVLLLKAEPSITEPSPGTEAASLVNAGYAAFGQGDLALAERCFRSAAEVLPSWALPHNNLGFTLLTRGDPKEALKELEQGRLLGYEQDEISDANIGCAMYLSGRYAAAQAKFDECLRLRGLKGPSILYGIDGDKLFIENVGSASEYSALMSINAAWSAKRVGDLKATQRYQGVATAESAALTLSVQFTQSLANLHKPATGPLKARNRRAT